MEPRARTTSGTEKHPRRWLLLLLPPFLVGMALSPVLAIAPATAPVVGPAAAGPRPARDTLPSPPGMTPSIRELLHQRMARHSEDMSQLLSRVLLLKYDEVVTTAERIATAQPLVRPLPGDAESPALPERFYLLQEELRQRARAVSEAARARDDQAMTRSFGQLTETCVSCHVAFRGKPAR